MGLLSFLQQGKENKNPIHSTSSKSLNSFEAKNNVDIESQLERLKEKGHSLAESIEILFLLDQLGQSKEDFIKERSVYEDDLYILEDGSSFELKNNRLIRKIKDKSEIGIESDDIKIYNLDNDEELNNELDEIFNELDEDINLQIETIVNEKEVKIDETDLKNGRKVSRFSLKN